MTSDIRPVASLLAELRAQGVQLVADNQRLRVSAPKGVLTDALREELASRKSELMAWLVVPPLVPADRTGSLPLSFAQQRLWFFDQLEGRGAVYNLPSAVRLTGKLDRHALQQSLDALAARHESLRSVVATDLGRPAQSILPAGSVAMPLVEAAGDTILERLLSFAAAPFDLQRDTPIRALLLREAPDRHVLALVLHHIAADGWSLGVLQRELEALYGHFANGGGAHAVLPDLPVQYADYAVWQRHWLNGPALEARLAYWRDVLAGAPALLHLPSDRPRPASRSDAGGSVRCHLDPACVAAVKAFARAQGATPFMVLLAAFATLLARLSGESDLVIGTSVAGRDRPEIEGIIGFFVNELALRLRCGQSMCFADLVAQARDVTLDAFAHQDLPFQQVVEALRPERSLSHAPVFQVTFVLQTAAAGALALPGLDVEALDIAHGGAKFDLSLVAEEQWDGSLRCDFEYSVDLFDRATIERWAGHFATLLGGALAAPDRPIEMLALLTPDQRREQLERWNDTARRFPADVLLPDWFAAGAARTPELPAVIGGSQSICYGDLASRVHRIARRLIALGIGPDDVVGVCLKRTPDLPASLLGVQAAGAAYVPLDPDYPADRLAFMAADSGAAAIIATRETARHLPQDAAPVLLLDDAAEQVRLAGQPDAAVTQGERRRPLVPDDLAYVLYTSGSTGRPKGVMVTQRGIAHYIDWAIREFGLGPGRGAPVNTSFAFDATLLTLNAPLYAGAAITLIPEDQEIMGLAAALSEHRGFAVVKVTPSHLELLNQIMWPDRADGAAGAFAIGGEPLTGAALSFWRNHAPSLRLCNEYGPTEITVGCSLHTVTADDPDTGPISIGGPNPNYVMHILDRRLEPVPIGVAGELYIGGVGVSRGYLHRPDMTAERFIANPFGEGRLYKSGDLVRRRADGRMEFLSRTDRQVKLRGHRIELGEIEAALRAVSHVAEAVVQIKPDRHGQQRLVAYVGGGDASPSAAELIRGLSQSLPSYMLPTAVVRLERLPLSPNGKVDYAALPVPDSAEANPDDTQPRNAAERTLCQIWEEVLGRRPIGIHSNFFGLGGDSIVSLQVVARARQAGFRLTPKQLFQCQTVAELAAVAEQAGAIDTLLEASGGVAPLTPIQRWFFGQHFAAPQHFNQALLLTLADGIDAAMLRPAIGALAERHEALRLRIAGAPEARQQEIAAEAPREALSVIDLSFLSRSEYVAARDEIAAAIHGDFRLDEGLLLRAAWFRPAPGQPSQLLLAIHHLAIDGVSWRILLDDLAAALAALRSGHSIDLPPVGVSWTQWASRLACVTPTEEERRYVAELAVPEPLPRDIDGEPGCEADASSVSFRLTRQQTTALLEEANRAYRTQVPELLLAALALALQDWADGAGPVIELEGHGREDIVEGLDLSRTVGWFTTLYPVHLPVDGAAGTGAAIVAVRHAVRSVPRHGLGIGLDIWGAAAAAPAPQAEIVFNYLGQWSFAFPEAGGIAAVDAGPGPLRAPRNRRAHALAIDCFVRDGVLDVDFEYDGRRWHRATIDAVAQGFAARLDAVLAHCADPARWLRTPGDFPLAQLTQAGLDRLLRQPFAVEDILPATPLQQGMLFHAELAKGSDIWFEQMALTLRGNLHGEKFRAAWAVLLQRHAVLRGSFARDEREQSLMVVAAGVALDWHTDDWSDLSRAEQRARADAYLAWSRERGFALDRPPLLRFALIRMAPDRHWFVFNHAHMLLDGWSVPVLFREAFAAYAALETGRAPALPPVRPFRAYLEFLSSRDRDEARDFWRGELAGLSAPTPLAGPARTGNAGGAKRETYAVLSPDDTARVENFARERRLTIATIVQAAWAILLSRYSGETGVLFGATVSGRPAELPDIERMVGLFVNTVPVHATVDPNTRLVPWLIALQDRQQQREAHASASLVDIHGWSEIPPSLPLFETAIAFENYPAFVAASGTADAIAVDDLQVTLEATNFPLSVQVVMGRTLQVKLTYDSDRFPASLIAQIAEHFTRLLRILPANPDAALETFDIDPPERQRALAAAGNDAARPYPAARTDQLIAAQASRTPDRIAVAADDRSLTYADLRDETQRVAATLQAHGIGRGDRVAVYLPRDSHLLPGLLGVLTVGAAYVPLDPIFPRERLAMALEDSRAAVVLSVAALAHDLPDGTRTILLDGPDLAPVPVVPIDSDAGLSDTAYLIFTSGSTGRPKGVSVTHRGLSNILHAVWREPGIGPDDVWLATTTITFDIAAAEILLPLLVGARLVLMSRDRFAEADRIAAALDHHGATIMQGTPANWRMLVGAGWQGRAGLRAWSVGEALSTDLVEALRSRCARVWNLYGPTETAIYSSLQPALGLGPPNGSEPIGTPVANTQIYLLDRRLRIVPDGAPGEICIAGDGLADGYQGAPHLTCERFIANPFGPPGSRLYRTGDLGTRRADGSIDFLGRRDHQIKLRGFRIEAGDVEAALRAHPGVRAAAVLVHGAADNAVLAGYVVPAITDADIAAAAAEHAEQSKAMFDGIYSGGAVADAAFDIRGWTDSATRQSVPEAEMRDWVETTLARLQAFGARRVLEIGCGSGLILSRLAPGTESYMATEISTEALATVADLVAQRPSLSHVALHRREATDFSGIADGSVDLCVINSVVQYFPSREYLCTVIRQAMRALAPDGVLFIGDVRSLPLLVLFHAHVLRRGGADNLDRAALTRRLRRAAIDEEELVLDPAFFAGFGGDCRIALKRGRGHNEIVLFRYDVTIRPRPVAPEAAATVHQGAASLAALETALTARAADSVLVRGIANRRLALDRATLAWRDGGGDAPTLGTVRLPAPAEQNGIDPEAVYRLGESLGYDVALAWSNDGTPGDFDAAFRRGGDAAMLLPPPAAASPDANIPQFGRIGRRLVADLRRTLRDRLPDYMVPSQWMVLDALPLTSSGKLDRRALAAPEETATTLPRAAPRSPEEEVIAGIWADVLGRDMLGIDEDFFLHGGQSLLATQAVARIRTAFGIDVPLKWLFEAPTVAAFAARLATMHGHRITAPIVARSQDAPLVLSFAQRRLWFLHYLEGPSATYNTPGAFELKGALDRTALAAALQQIVQRHAVLRSIFPSVDGEPRPEILPADRFVLRDVDLVATEAREADLAELLSAEAAHLFDIAAELPFRALLVRLAPRRHVLAITMHHIVSDLWSIGVFSRELAQCYTAAGTGQDAALPPLPLSFFDYAAWQQETAADAAMAESLAWWRRSLAGAPPALDLPTAQPRPAKTGLRAAAVPVALNQAAVTALESISRGAGATLFMTLLAGFALLLGRQAGQDCVVIGTPIAGRTRSEIESLIGFFVNTLALRVDLDRGLSARALIAQTRQMALEAFAHQEVPFDRLVEELNPPRHMGRSPIFQAMFVWQNVPPAQAALPGLSLTSLAPPLMAPKFELTLVLEPGPTGITGQLEYDADLFDSNTVTRWARRLEQLWQRMAAESECALPDLVAVDAADARRLIGLGRGAVHDLAPGTIVDRVRAAAASWPDAAAIEADGTAISYTELLARAENVAQWLLGEGVGAEEIIGVWADRGATAAIGFLGVLLSGCAYLPLDRTLPSARLELMRQRAGVRRVLDVAATEAASPGRRIPLPQLSRDGLAYVIYTSGSTGEPKGVMVPHGGLLNLALAQANLLRLLPGSRLLRFVAPVFDVAIGEIASVLAAGGTLVELPARGVLPGDELGDLLHDRRITHLQMTASTLPVLPRRALPDLEVLVVGGEPCAPDVAAWWAQNRRLINAYGPTEATVCAIAGDISAFAGRLPLGAPLANVSAYVLDDRLRPVEEGIAGELCLGGLGVARGYAGRAAHTAERFVPDLFGPPGSRMYRTGDLVRWRAGGKLEFLGREDGQIKLRGYRIEQGEVEAALLSHPGVREAAVAAHGSRLVGYVAGGADLAALRAHIEARLPDYMVPAQIVHLDALPRTVGGKLDRRSLPEPAAPAEATTPPDGETETALALLWQELLGIEAVGRESHFFALGGHSLLAARLQARIQPRFQVALPLRTIFEAPTLAGLASAIDTARTSQVANDSAAAAIPILRRERRRSDDVASHARSH